MNKINLAIVGATGLVGSKFLEVLEERNIEINNLYLYASERSENKVIVEGINMVKKHVKPRGGNETGGIVDVEAKIDASNVMLIDPKQIK